MDQLTAADSQALWLSAAMPSDQFLVFAFQAVDLAKACAHLLVRARASAGLGVRVRDVPGGIDYPYWVPAVVDDDWFSVDRRRPSGTDEVMAVLTEIMAVQLDAHRMPWRCHLFTGDMSAPSLLANRTFVVLQVSHAFADGRLATDFARHLLGGGGDLPECTASAISNTLAVTRGLGRLPLQVRRLVRDVRRAEVLRKANEARVEKSNPIARGGVPASPLNRHDPSARLRAVMVHRSAVDLRPNGVSVTVGALTAISDALASYLGERSRLAAETTISKPGPRNWGNKLHRNHFRNVGVDLHGEVADPYERAKAIEASLSAARDYGDHRRACAQVTESVPAPLLALGVRAFDPAVRSPTVTGITVVSSVNRGPDDLRLCGAPVIFTAGFPALSPMQGLTHGVHGIGHMITISVLADAGSVDLDRYLTCLGDALDSVAAVSNCRSE